MNNLSRLFIIIDTIVPLGYSQSRSMNVKPMKFILGTKGHMTQFFTDDGVVVPVTIVKVPPAVVTQVRTKERDGYEAVQIASGERAEKNIPKPLRGHFAGKGNFRYVKEFRPKRGEDISEYKVGDEITLDIFSLENPLWTRSTNGSWASRIVTVPVTRRSPRESVTLYDTLESLSF